MNKILKILLFFLVVAVIEVVLSFFISPMIILGTSIGATIGIVIYWAVEDIGALIVAPIVGFLVFGVLYGVGGERPSELVKSDYKRIIVSLKDNASVHGRFFLGCGNVDGNMEYYGYESLGRENYSLMSFDAYSTIIVEDIKNGESPYFVEYYSMETKNWEWNGWFKGPRDTKWHDHYEIHIPKGSIKMEQYNLDAE